MWRINIIIEDIFSLPRTFLAWIVFHLARLLDMRVIPNDAPEDYIEEIWDAFEYIDSEEMEEEDEI